jgi:DNA-binding NtrC family response regulator
MQRILLVEDDNDTGYLFNMILRMKGYMVDTFTDPIKALSVFKPGYYDLIILDYHMTGVNGLEFIQNVRKIDESIKTILVTAWEIQSIGDAMQKYCVKILTKPVPGDVLVQEVKHALINVH